MYQTWKNYKDRRTNRGREGGIIGNKEWISQGRTFKLGKMEWERRVCIQTRNMLGNRGWEEKLEVENWWSPAKL